jgi:hypothetical protein
VSRETDKRMDDDYGFALDPLGLVGGADEDAGQISQASGDGARLVDVRGNHCHIARVEWSTSSVGFEDLAAVEQLPHPRCDCDGDHGIGRAAEGRDPAHGQFG